MRDPVPVPAHHVLKSLKRRFGCAFIANELGISKSQVTESHRHKHKITEKFERDIRVLKARCYGFIPHKILMRLICAKGKKDASVILELSLSHVGVLERAEDIRPSAHLLSKLLIVWEEEKAVTLEAYRVRKLAMAKAKRDSKRLEK